MKKIMIAALAVFTLASCASQAQRPYGNNPYPNNQPTYGYNNGYGNNRDYRADDFQDEMKIERLDAIVGLSNRQERQIRQIEQQYDMQMSRVRMTPQGMRQMMTRKQNDIMSVLTRSQRERLFAYQQQNRNGRYNNGNYNNGRYNTGPGYYGGRS